MHWPDDLRAGLLVAIAMVPKERTRTALIDIANGLDLEQQADRYIALRLTDRIYQRYASPLTPTTDGV